MGYLRCDMIWGISVRQTLVSQENSNQRAATGSTVVQNRAWKKSDQYVTVWVLHTFIVTLLFCFQCWMLFYPFLFQPACVVRFNKICLSPLQSTEQAPVRWKWTDTVSCDSQSDLKSATPRTSWKVLRWTWHLCVLGLDKHSWEAWQNIWRKSGDTSIY